MRRLAILALLWLGIAQPAVAQPQIRTIEVPANAAWQHAETRLILPPRAAGLTRVAVRDTGTAELDIVAAYESPNDSMTATIYLFRPQVKSVPLWFDRATTVIRLLPRYAMDDAAPRAPVAFAPPDSETSSALKASFATGLAAARSTAVAVVPLGGWIVKVRASSSALGPAALDARMIELIEALRWPGGIAASPAAVPIADCLEPLELERARKVEAGIEQALLGGLGALMTAKPAPAGRTYCREPGATVATGVYRADQSTDSYLVALADSGRAISVGPAITLEGPQQFSISLLDLGRTLLFPSFDRLPPLRQTMATLSESRPISSVEVGTTTVTISSDTE